MNEKNPFWWASLQTVVLVLLFAFLVISVSGCGPAHQGIIVVDRKTTFENPVVLIHEDQHTLILKNPVQHNNTQLITNSQACSSKLLHSSAPPSSAQ